jgi:Mg/Co/Ni transporter MgtE
VINGRNFLELEDDLRENILSRLSPKEIAEELDELDVMRPILSLSFSGSKSGSNL